MPESVLEINDVSSILTTLYSVFEILMNMISSVSSAFKTFYTMLKDFDETVLLLGSNASDGTLSGLPILESIGTFRYLVGDIAFYAIYCLVLFGCLMCILKLVYLVMDAWNATVHNGSSSSSFKAGIAKVFSYFIK